MLWAMWHRGRAGETEGDEDVKRRRRRQRDERNKKEGNADRL